LRTIKKGVIKQHSLFFTVFCYSKEQRIGPLKTRERWNKGGGNETTDSGSCNDKVIRKNTTIIYLEKFGENI
jgi:hypothetical protein